MHMCIFLVWAHFYVHIFGGQKIMSHVFSVCSILYLLSQGLSLYPELTTWAKLGRELPVLFPACWNYRYTTLPTRHLPEQYGSELQSLYLFGKHRATPQVISSKPILYLLFYLKIYFYYLHVCVYVCAIYECIPRECSAHKCQKKTLYPLELELQVFLSYHMAQNPDSVLSTRAASALN